MKRKHKLIYSSTDYSKFVQDDHNRDARTHRKLLASLTKRGWRDSYPAVVVPDGGKFRIKDGGHRITIARQLGIPVYYTVDNDADSIPTSEINNAQMPWTNADYISSHIKRGIEDYKKLSAFSAETGVPIGTAAGLLCGGNSCVTEKIRDGSFRITTEDHARAVLAVVGAASNIVKWAKSQKFIAAVSQILRYSRASHKTLCDKIRTNGGMLIPQVTTEGNIEMLEHIYNYKNREVLSISMAVKQSLRQIRQDMAAKANLKKK